MNFALKIILPMRVAAFTIRFWCIILWACVTPAAFSQSFLNTPLAMSDAFFGDQSNSNIAADDFAEEAPNDGAKVEKEELALSQDEIRDKFYHGVALTGGVSVPWEKVNLQFHWQSELTQAWIYGVGGGHFDITDERSSRTYSISTDAHSAWAGWRYYFTDFAPLFVQPLLGFGVWEGRIEPKGADPALDTAATKLDSGFTASGVLGGINLGIVRMWESGFYLEYSIYRLGKALLVKHTFTSDNQDAKDAVMENLEHPFSWGFLNLTVGWYF